MIQLILSWFKKDYHLNGGLKCNHFYDAEYRNVAIHVESKR